MMQCCFSSEQKKTIPSIDHIKIRRKNKKQNKQNLETQNMETITIIKTKQLHRTPIIESISTVKYTRPATVMEA